MYVRKTKWCSLCKKNHRLKAFYKDNSKLSKLGSSCKVSVANLPNRPKLQTSYIRKTKWCVACQKNHKLEDFYKNNSEGTESFSSSCKMVMKRNVTATKARYKQNNLKSLPILIELKCQKCKDTLPIKDFYMCSTNKNGRSYVCKKCKSEKEKILLQKRRERTSISYPNEKQCSKCKKNKFAKYFQKDITKASGLSSWCKTCTSEDNKNSIINLDSGYIKNRIVFTKDILRCEITDELIEAKRAIILLHREINNKTKI